MSHDLEKEECKRDMVHDQKMLLFLVVILYVVIALIFLSQNARRTILCTAFVHSCSLQLATTLLVTFQRWHIFVWSPGNRSGPYWSRMEYPSFELPRDTLIEAELVSEFRGEV